MADILSQEEIDALLDVVEDSEKHHPSISTCILYSYQSALESTLGAIAAHSLIQSRESSRVIRECSKQIDSMSTQLRKELLSNEKLLVVSNDPN